MRRAAAPERSASARPRARWSCRRGWAGASLVHKCAEARHVLVEIGQLLHRSPTSGAETRPLGGAIQEVLDGPPQSAGIVWWHVEAIRLEDDTRLRGRLPQQALGSRAWMTATRDLAAVLNHIGLANTVGHDHGLGHRHGFEDRGNARLKVDVIERHDDDRRARVQVAQGEVVETVDLDVARSAASAGSV